jgi:hypothetical protein
MKTTVAVLIAATLWGAAPALACGTFFCLGEAVGDDNAPPRTTPLPPSIEAQIRYRDGRGLSQAGFYNDPSVYMGESGVHVIESPYGRPIRERY